MDHPEGAGLQRADRVDFDPRVRLEFKGTQLSSDGGLLVVREVDDALGLSDLAATALRDTRCGKNTIHRLDGLFRQSVFGRLAGLIFSHRVSPSVDSVVFCKYQTRIHAKI